MKQYLSNFLFTAGLSVCMFTATAQTNTAAPVTTPVEKKSDDSGIYIPPLVDIIDSAIRHNAMVKYRYSDITAKKTNVKSEKLYWTRNLGLQADTRYGTFDNFASTNNAQTTSFYTSTTRQFNYGLGVFFKFPLFDLVNRRNQIRHAEAEVTSSEALAENQENEVRQMVIKQYQELLVRQKLVSIKAQALGNAKVNANMIDKEFRNGLIPVVEYVRVSDIVSRAESDYELAKAEFITAKLILEDMAGFTFSNTAVKK